VYAFDELSVMVGEYLKHPRPARWRAVSYKHNLMEMAEAVTSTSISCGPDQDGDQSDRGSSRAVRGAAGARGQVVGNGIGSCGNVVAFDHLRMVQFAFSLHSLAIT